MNNLTKKQVSNFFIREFSQIPLKVSINGNIIDIVTENGNKLRWFISRRLGDEFFPKPTFAFSAEFMANFGAVGARAILVIGDDNLVLIHPFELQFIRDEFGEFVALYGANLKAV